VPATKVRLPRAGALALAIVFSAALPAQAQDARRGRQLYETLCLTCHYEHVHERVPARSNVHSLKELRKETALRAGLTGVRFTREDIEDVVAYLDQSHYHFSK